MKKVVLGTCVTSLALITAFSLAACGGDPSSEYVLPSLSVAGNAYTVAHITNMEQDFEFPIEGVKFEHSKFTDERALEYGWVLYDNNRNIVGWFEDLSNGYEEKGGKWYYGYSPSYNNDVYTFGANTFALFWKTNDLTEFEKISFTTNHGTITRNNDPCGPASEKYSGAGAENFSYCTYIFDLFGIEPNEVQRIDIVINFASE